MFDLIELTAPPSWVNSWELHGVNPPIVLLQVFPVVLKAAQGPVLVQKRVLEIGRDLMLLHSPILVDKCIGGTVSCAAKCLQEPTKRT